MFVYLFEFSINPVTDVGLDMPTVVDTETHCLGSLSGKTCCPAVRCAVSRQPPAGSILGSASAADSHFS